MPPISGYSGLERVRQYVLRSGRFLMGKDGIVVARLLTAIQDDPVLRLEFLERVYSPNTREIQVAVEDAIREGQLPPTNVAQFLDMVFGPIITRLLIRHEPIREPFVNSVFEHVVAGVKANATKVAAGSESEPT